MAIQFNCASCSAVLRVGDESAGKSARCPTCQSVQPVPGGTTQAASPLTDPFADFNKEFSPAGTGDFSSTKAANPYASPVSLGLGGTTAVGIFQPTSTDFGEIFSHAWEAYKPNLGVLLGATLITFGISIGFSILTSILNVVADQNNMSELRALTTVIDIFSSFLNLYLGIGMARICIAAARFQPTSIGTLFGGGDKFLPVFGGTILYMLGAMFGFIMLILPGFIFLLLCWTYYYFITDRQCGVFEAFSRAFAVGKKNWLTSIVMGFMSMMISLAGVLALGIGLLFAAPFIGVMFATGYIMMKGERPMVSSY